MALVDAPLSTSVRSLRAFVQERVGELDPAVLVDAPRPPTCGPENQPRNSKLRPV